MRMYVAKGAVVLVSSIAEAKLAKCKEICLVGGSVRGMGK